MHKCWTCSGGYYLELFGMYVKSSSTESEFIGLRLSVSPMTKLFDFDSTFTCSCGFETANFESQMLSCHIRAMFEFYDICFSEWAVFQIADNSNVNKTVTANLSTRNLGCVNYKLNLDVIQVIPRGTELKSCADCVHGKRETVVRS